MRETRYDTLNTKFPKIMSLLGILPIEYNIINNLFK